MHNQNRIFRVLQLIAILQKAPTKSIRNLATLLDNTERTTYRYLELIKNLGFDLQKDSYNKYFIINDTNIQNIGFTEQEANLLSELLQSTAKQNKLKDSILQKIYLNNEIAMSGNNLLKAHLGKLVETLSKAILTNKQVVLKKYHSANSKTISDRLVEPIKFTDNYTSLAAYEIESGQNKYFNIERIADIKILTKNFKFKDKHQFNSPDAFGFGETTQKFEINIRLNIRAYVILKEEYPMVMPFIKVETKKTNTFLLNIVVNDLKPITRFVLGLIEDVEVLGSDAFIIHLKQITEHYVKNKLNINIKTKPMKATKKNEGIKKASRITSPALNVFTTE